MKKYLKFLKEHKELVGLSDWTIILKKGSDGSKDFAKVQPDTLEKELDITLLPEFFKLTCIRKKNILFHELLHGRVLVMREEVTKKTSEEEEKLVNDVIRGFERYGLRKKS